jgi:short-subunit dehydrogenase
MGTTEQGMAVVTGASSGIGLELARELGRQGFDLIVAADGAAIEDAARELRGDGSLATPVVCDLATPAGVEVLVAAVEAANRPPTVLAVNAGVGTSGPFARSDLDDQLRLIALNVTGAVHLTHRLLPAMVRRQAGRLLFTSSVAATQPGPFESTYAASKAFLYSFAEALRVELEDSGVTVTALMPGPTDTAFFERAGLLDTKLGQGPKDDPADVARAAIEALLAGKDHIVPGSLKSKAMAAAGKALPGKTSARLHATMSEPQSDEG